MRIGTHRTGWIQPFRVLLRMELRRLGRTSQVYTYVLLPALLILPSGVFLGVAAVSLQVDAQVAVPVDLPAELALVEALEDGDFDVVVHADPGAAWLSGEVQAAVLEVERGEGLAAAKRELERAERSTWVVHIVAEDALQEARLRAVVDDAGDELLADLVALSGGVVEKDLWVAQVDRLPVDKPPPFSKTRALWAYIVFAVGMIGFFFASLSGVADRNAGVTETLLAGPVRASQLLAARLVAVLVLQLLAALLMAANVVMLLSNVDDLRRMATLSPQHYAALLISLLGAVALSDALYVLVGTWSANAKAANNIGGAVMMGLLGLLGLGVMGDPPAWLPMAGVAASDTAIDHVVAGLSCLVAAGAVLALTARRLERNVSLKLSTEGR